MSIHSKTLSLLRQSLDNPEASFRDGQWEAVENLVVKRAKLLLVQRTGWGKSVVYFLATKLLRDDGAGPALLISPLLALMRNQIEAAKRIGIRAATINSSNVDEWRDVKFRLARGEVDILLISPERLANDSFRNTVLTPMANRIGFFVVDEAHCISDWGHDFRPDYRRIVRILQALPVNIPVLATTATANNRVIDDVQRQLGPDFRAVCGNLTRDSLHLQNITMPHQAARYAWLAEHLPSLPGSGIVYVLTVNDAKRLAKWLKQCRIDAEAYYGNLESYKRVELEDRLLANRIKALVSTTALGMGFDKPDLGFVVHFQRPWSIIHYYQQVGRAGRAVEDAYGIMLCGKEDDEIIDYFIRSAFPPQADVKEILNTLEQSEDGLTLTQLERVLNIPRSRIMKALGYIVVETPSPVKKVEGRWYRSPVNYQFDAKRVERLTLIRREEQARMQAYASSERCLMEQLRAELNDPGAEPCGHCAVCMGKPLIPEVYSDKLANRAVKFLRHCYLLIIPRTVCPEDALPEYGLSGELDRELRFKEGRALCLWGDAGWGEWVRQGKQITGSFDDKLVIATEEMINRHWRPDPFPVWLTYVPSLRDPGLVQDFARKLAKRLGIRFRDCIHKLRENQPQKEMQNSYQQACNLDGVFYVDGSKTLNKPVFLVDDMVDSRWTFTVLAALLRRAGSGEVFPLALSMTTSK